MAVTRSVTRKKNQDECSRKRAKTPEESGSAPPWLDLIDDILFLILLRLGIADFVSFSGVCKRWRSFALSNKKMFLTTRQPMSLYFSTVAYKKYCYLEDFQSRRFKTSIPHSAGRTCIGLTCGYLILYGTKAYDFWLVNVITRHELHFPRYPIHDPSKVRGVLVFSPSMSGWVFVVSRELSNFVSFCLAGKEVRWNHVFTDFPIHDLHFFKGKIYALITGSRICEVRLTSKPTSTLLGIRNLDSDILLPEFASWGEKLYVMGYESKDVYGAIMEVDFDQMIWVRPKETMENYVCFANEWKPGGAGKVGLWVHPRGQYERFGYFHGTDKVNNKDRRFDSFNSNMWYYPHDCLSVNCLQE